MIDMRGEGDVQYDGFEYNWVFRRKKWRPNVGFLSAGGFVRRRRWVRLMMRPAKHSKVEHVQLTDGSAAPAGPEELTRDLASATRPPSVATTTLNENADIMDVWQGDEGDWPRCRAALRRLGRDGKKLELWTLWLGCLIVESENGTQGKGKAPRKQWTEDDEHLPSERAREEELAADVNVTLPNTIPEDRLAAVIRAHVRPRTQFR